MFEVLSSSQRCPLRWNTEVSAWSLLNIREKEGNSPIGLGHHFYRTFFLNSDQSFEVETNINENVDFPFLKDMANWKPVTGCCIVLVF